MPEHCRRVGGRIFSLMTAVDICRIEVKSAACLFKGFGARSGSQRAGVAQCLWPSRDLPSCTVGKADQAVLVFDFAS